jgi:hypothetical protein
VARQLVVKIRIAIIGALLAIASAANADVGDTYQQLVHRFKSPPLPAGSWQSSAGNVVLVQFNTGYYVTTVMLIDGIVDGEAFQSTRHESSTKTNVSWLFDREMFKYGGSNNRWRRWTIYRLQSGWGYARPDGRMFVEATQDSDNLWGVAVVSDKGYRAVGSEMRSVTQSPNNLQQQPAVQSKENDCMIVASEYYSRLEKMPWRNILNVTFKDQQLGHAFAAWKITPNGTVWLADGSGSFELQTTSTSIEDVLTELQRALAAAQTANTTRGYQILRGKWEFSDDVAFGFVKARAPVNSSPERKIGSSTTAQPINLDAGSVAMAIIGIFVLWNLMFAKWRKVT